MKKLLLTITLLVTTTILAQAPKIAASFFTSVEVGQGFEIRPEFEEQDLLFESWYMSFKVENFIAEDINHLSWMGGIGIIKETRHVDFLAGLQFGKMYVQNFGDRFLHGFEAEIDLKLTQDLFIAVRGTYDSYYTAEEDYSNIRSEGEFRAFIKIGYKFF